MGFGAGVGPAVPVAVAGGPPSTGCGPLIGVPADNCGNLPETSIFSPPAPACECCWASDDVTVVLDTCRDPDERRPLDEPAINVKIKPINKLVKIVGQIQMS